MRFKVGAIIKLEYSYSTNIVKIVRIINEASGPLYEVETLEELRKVPYRWVRHRGTTVLAIEYTDRLAIYLGTNEKVVRTLYLDRPLNEQKGS